MVNSCDIYGKICDVYGKRGLNMGDNEISNRKKELKKHTSLIHCSNTLTLLQRKISNVLLFHAYANLLDHAEHKISIRELCSYLRYQGGNYDALKQALRALISTVIEWNLTHDDTKGEDWTASSLLASVNIKGAVCTYAYSPRMKQLLYSPSMYGKINLFIQSNFTSSYGLVLYENCVRYRGLSKTKVFPIDLFRKIMGVPDNKYPVFRDFKRRVIDKAVEEVNALTDIIIVSEIKRVGWKVMSITFYLSDREKKKKFYLNTATQQKGKKTLEQKSDNDYFSQKNKLIKEKMMKQFFVSSGDADTLIANYGADKIDDKIKTIESLPTYKAEKINNLAGFFVDALKNNYMPAKSIKVLAEQNRKVKDEENQKMIEGERLKELIYKDYEKYLNESSIKFLEEIDTELLDNIKLKFVDYLSSPSNQYALGRFKKEAFANKTVLALFRVFLGQFYPDLAVNFCSFERFKELKNGEQSH
jgi:plasmid replication initiation protein